jgi:hypothetical protein
MVDARTGGEVLGGASFSVGHGFVLRFPDAGWHCSTGAIVEAWGVQPHVEVPLSLEGLRVGNDNQLERTVAEVERL